MPRLTLQRKIFLALASLLLAMVGLFMVLTQWGLQVSLGEFIAEVELQRMDWLASRLVQRRVEAGSWDFLRQEPELWEALLQAPPGRPPRPLAAGFHERQAPPRPDRDGPGAAEGRDTPPWPEAHAPGPPRPMPPESPYARLGLLDADGQRWLAGARSGRAGPDWPRLPLEFEGRPLGYLTLQPLADLGGQANQAFLTRQLWFAACSGLIGLVLALAISWFLGRRWFAPVAELMAAARLVAQGRPAPAVPARGTDELAALGQTFNEMNRQLGAIEASRQRWLGDVAHELRTPLGALRAEIEALQDGVREFGPASAERLHRQVMRLSQLVDDLRLSLDQPDTVELMAEDELAPLPLLDEALGWIDERRRQAGLALRLDLRDREAMAGVQLRGDERRLQQVFLNLLENSLRYTHRGGLLRIEGRLEGARRAGEGGWLHLVFDDSAPAPHADELPRLSERFYRGEHSRSRALGGSGLGLSICQRVLSAHGGRISFALSSLGGLQVSLSLPVQKTPDTAAQRPSHEPASDLPG